MADSIDTQIASLQRAMASGVLTVEGADTGRVTYRSYAEMRSALADLKARQASALGASAPRRTRQIVVTGRSGF